MIVSLRRGRLWAALIGFAVLVVLIICMSWGNAFAEEQGEPAAEAPLGESQVQEGEEGQGPENSEGTETQGSKVKEGQDEGNAEKSGDPVEEGEEPQATVLAATSDYTVTISPVKNTTTANVKVPGAATLLSNGDADKVKIVSTLSYGSKVMRTVTKEYSLSDIGSDGVTMDFGNYGRHVAVITFTKGGTTVKEAKQDVDITANIYNISPVSASLPVTFFSLNLWGNGNIRESGPVILMMERPAAYNWDKLPAGVYGLPYLTDEELRYQPGDFNDASNLFRSHEQAMADYTKMLYQISPDSHFNLWCVDFYADLVQKCLYANKIPQGQYSIRLLSDGSYTPSSFRNTYKGEDPTVTQAAAIAKWTEAKEYAYANGKVKDGFGAGQCGWYMWAITDSEPDAQLWVTRKDLLTTSGDNNAYGAEVQKSPKLVAPSISGLLASNIQSSEQNTKEFKTLYDFNDSFFSEAEKNGKDVMMFLGSRVTSEQTFSNYARLVKTYYGDDYQYYYKGHPGTPTDLYPEKISQLEALGVTDVDSSIAAELILFFNPEIYLSGYASTTYASVPEGMGKGMFSMTKATGTAESNPQYHNMDFWSSLVTDSSAANIKELCILSHENYLVEFSDKIIAKEGYDIAIWDATASELIFFKLQPDGHYKQVGSKSGEKAMANILAGTYVIESAIDKGHVLDVQYGATYDGGNVQIYGYNASDAQKWTVSYDGDGYATLTNVQSGKVLDANAGRSDNGTNIHQWAPNGTKAQKWRLVANTDGSIKLVSALSETAVVDLNAANVEDWNNIHMWQDNASAAQQWRFISAPPQVSAEGQADLADGYYRIVSAADRTKALDLNSWSSANGANIQVWQKTGQRNQLFKLTKMRNGYYRIVCVPSGKSLDVEDSSLISGANVQQWAPYGGENQEWAIVQRTGGSYTLQNVGSGLMLDIKDGKTANGSNVQGWRANGTQAQRWLFECESTIKDNVYDLAAANKDTLKDGTYYISSLMRFDRVLDVENSTYKNGANVFLAASANKKSQKWIVAHDKDGFVSLQNANSDKFLDVSGAWDTNGTNIWQYKGNKSQAQKWVVVPSDKGGFQIVSALAADMVVDIAAGSSEVGANVNLWADNGSAAQRFNFVKA